MRPVKKRNTWTKPGPGRPAGSLAKMPHCPACKAAGSKPVKSLKWFKVDGRVKAMRVWRAGRMVTRQVAWTSCQRPISRWSDETGPVCGWSWWCAVPALVERAMAHPSHRLLRRHQQPPGTPGRGGRVEGRGYAD